MYNNIDENYLHQVQSLFSRMNDKQKEAVFCTEGPLLILAGAGSGKTTVLVNRIAYILKLGLCYPWQILAITFTNKAANELKERISAVVGEGSADVWAATFHSTCARILRIWGERIGYSSHFTVYDSDDQKRLVKDILKQLNINEKTLSYRTVLSEISRYKDKMKTPDDMKKNAEYDSRLTMIAQAYAMYEERLKSSDAMDFDDLLLNTVRLFENNNDVLEKYQNQFKYLMVDEYQDTNKVQYKFVSLLANKSNNICVVGDDDQSIYKFRGATIENILTFENEFRGTKVVRLEQNYRSTKNILSVANEVIKNNEDRKGKTLWTDNSIGDKVVVHTSLNERDEGKYIADVILDGVAKGRNYSDYAILYRANAQSNAIEQVLSRSGIPHRVIGGHRFFDREEIRDMVSYLHVINNPSDDLRLKRIINKPKRGIGDTSVNNALEIANQIGESLFSVIKHASDYPTLSRASSKMMNFANLIEGFINYYEDEVNSVSDLYELILEHTDYKNYLINEKDNSDTKIENIEELASNIINFEDEYEDEATLTNFLEEIALITDIDNYDKESDTAVMMTMHSAKGLEFPIVFIPGMEDGLFPSMQTIMDPEEMSEERRLAYVGITRAKEKLYLVNTRERLLYGSTSHNSPSRFLSEIPNDLVEKTANENVYFKGKNSTASVQMNFNPFAKNKKISSVVSEKVHYSVGNIVTHNTFGRGMITSVTPMGSDSMIEIAFDNVGTKTLMANYAKLKIE